MLLTGRERERERERERARPLKFFYSEYEGQKTSPQAYVKEAIKRQQELNPRRIFPRRKQLRDNEAEELFQR